jgi:hypothetical protein
MKLNPWCHPDCHFFFLDNLVKELIVTTFSRLFACVGTTHLYLLVSFSLFTHGVKRIELTFFGQPLPKAFCAGFFHSDLSLCIGSLLVPLLILISFNAGQIIVNYY